MEASKSFTELIVWQKAHQFVLKTYVVTQRFPKEEIYGLSSQFRRAAMSIAANIAEGFARRGLRDKCRFLNISQSSLQECRYFLILSRDLKYHTDPTMNDLADDVAKLLSSYISAIQHRHP
ncbi:MAG TPA: four helix bundle protein [Chryseolinea sp.]